MKKNINVLFVNDLNFLLPDENPIYLIKKNNDKYEIKILPIVFKEQIKNIWNEMAYDFDLLNEKNKTIYQDKTKNLICIDDNIYKLNTKIYTLKKRK